MCLILLEKGAVYVSDGRGAHDISAHASNEQADDQGSEAAGKIKGSDMLCMRVYAFICSSQLCYGSIIKCLIQNNHLFSQNTTCPFIQGMEATWNN